MEGLLEKLMKDLGLGEEQFLLAVKIGLETENKKYFERILTVDNFIVFKNIMNKRNMELEEEAFL